MKRQIPRAAWIILALHLSATALQQLLYLTPAMTVTGVGSSMVLRRRGYALPGLLMLLIGPVLFALTVLIGQY